VRSSLRATYPALSVSDHVVVAGPTASGVAHMKAFESIDLIAQPGRAQTALRRIAHTVEVVLGRHMIDESEVRRTEGIANQLLHSSGSDQRN